MRNICGVKLAVAVVLIAGALWPINGFAANKFIVRDSGGSVDKFVVTDTGYVGIGTTSPLTAILAQGDNYASTQIISRYIGADPAASGGFIAKKNRPSSVNNGLPLSGDRIGYMLFGSVRQDLSDANAAGFGAYAEANWTDTSFPAYFAIETAPPSSSRTEKMRVTGSGNVGIGTTVPKSKLEVNGGVRIYPVTANANTESPTPSSAPTCNATTMGTIWFAPSDSGDEVSVCVKINGTYGYKAVTLAP